MTRILLISAGNPCRAIVAEALANKYLSSTNKVDIIGVGMSNDAKMNPNILKNLKAEGVDLEAITPHKLEEVLNQSFDLVVTLCDHSKENCPVFPDPVSTIHMGFPIVDEDEGACEELFVKIKNELIPILQNEIS